MALTLNFGLFVKGSRSSSLVGSREIIASTTESRGTVLARIGKRFLGHAYSAELLKLSLDGSTSRHLHDYDGQLAGIVIPASVVHDEVKSIYTLPQLLNPECSILCPDALLSGSPLLIQCSCHASARLSPATGEG